MPTRSNSLFPTAFITATLVTVLATFLGTTWATAQSWPQRTVRLIVSLGPGSGADIGARLLADRLAKSWGQSVVVENRPGGDTVTAITSVLNANDDHMLLVSPSSGFLAHPYTLSRMPYDPSQLLPIARVSNTIISASVSASSQIASMKELVAAAQSQPGQLNWAPVTGITDFQFQAFLRASGLQMARVPYRDAVQALNDLGEGRIHFYTSAYAISRSMADAGKIRVVAVLNSQRATILPSVPTMREAGFAALEQDGLIGFFSAPVVGANVREKIAADVIEAIKDAVILERLNATGQIPNPAGPAEFAASIERQRSRVTETAKALGLKRTN